MDRATLFTLVLAETYRADLAASLPDMLLLAEAKIARDLRCQEMTATDTLDTSSGAADLPDDFLGLRAVYDSTGPLQQVGLMEYRTATNSQRVFAIANRQILCRLAEVDLDYFARPAALSGDASTNDVLEAHPDLYVSLLTFYVQRRVQDLELAQTAIDSYNDSRDTLNELADRQRGAARLGKPYSFGSASAF
jgi:hypothetical protein